MLSSESFKAGSQARDYRRGSAGLAGDDPQGLFGFVIRSFDLPLPVPSHRSGRSEEADQGDLRDACPLWLPACVLHPAPRWLAREPEEGLQALQGVGLAAAQQDAQAAGQGEAARGSYTGGSAERCLGNGLCSRPAGNGTEAAHPDRGGYVLPAIAGDRSPVQLSRRGRGRHAGSCLSEDRLSHDDQGGQWQRVYLSRRGSVALPARCHIGLLPPW